MRARARDGGSSMVRKGRRSSLPARRCHALLLHSLGCRRRHLVWTAYATTLGASRGFLRFTFCSRSSSAAAASPPISLAHYWCSCRRGRWRARGMGACEMQVRRGSWD